MKFSVITLFPEMFDGVLNHSILDRGIKKGLIEVKFINIRDFGEGSHKTVDDRPYGGGIGMVLKVDVLHKAICAAKENKGIERVVIFDARGEKFGQKKAEDFSKVDHIILVCGRYEGFDERILDYVDDSLSIGDYVLTGGEIPAMAVIDSVSRLIPHVLEKPDATTFESFSQTHDGRILEHPQYTRPEVYNGKKVPEVLLSGHEAKINEFRKRESILITKSKRSDLIEPNSQD